MLLSLTFAHFVTHFLLLTHVFNTLRAKAPAKRYQTSRTKLIFDGANRLNTCQANYYTGADDHEGTVACHTIADVV